MFHVTINNGILIWYALIIYKGRSEWSYPTTHVGVYTPRGVVPPARHLSHSTIVSVSDPLSIQR